MYTPPAFGDISTSGLAISGILAALHHRTQTGEAIRLTTSLLASGIWCNHPRIIGLQDRTDGKESLMTWPAHPHELRNPFSNIYECKDGRMMLIGAGWETAYHKFMPAMGLEQYIDDPRFNTAVECAQNANALYHLIAAAFLTKDCAEWDKILEDIDIVHQELLYSRDIPKMEQAWANDYLTDMECPNGNHFVVPNSPVTFFGLDRTPTQHVGGVGCDTSKVLARYGYSEDEIKDMMEKGIAAGK
jgi:crotonobetainyl-CoA:carnitine CoA-transferase CaiB-like acyl-CoA transferase